MYSKKSQSELIENKDYNMVLLLPHNATKIKYFSKSFSIRFFLLVIKEYYVFLKVAANGRNYMQGWISERHTVERCTAVARTDDRIPPPPGLTYSFCYWQCSFSSSSLSVVLLFVLLSETLRHLSPNLADFVHLSRH